MPLTPERSSVNHPLCTPTQLRQLQEHVRFAYEHVPFYRALYDEAGCGPDVITDYADLMRLPAIDKGMIIANQEAAPPLGDLRSYDADKLARVYINAGSEYLVYSPQDFERLTELFSEQFEVMGVRQSDVVDISSTFHWVMAGTIMDPAMRRLGATVVAGGPGMSELRMKVMRQARVTAVEIFTPYAEELASRFTDYGVDAVNDLQIRLLIIGGELRNKDSKARLEAAWGGAAVREFYGVSEAGLLACECFEVGDGMHLSPRVVIEVIDPESGEHVPIGAPGEIVTTELYRTAQPFVRYRSGDITEGVIVEECACGRLTPRIKRILGRRSDIYRVKGQFLTTAVIQQVLRQHPQVTAWQVLLRRPRNTDVVVLKVVVDGQAGGHLADRLASEIRGVAGFTCQVELVDQLPADARQILDERAI